MPTAPELDHLVVATADLEAGRDRLERQLGCPLEPGGRHTDQGTHNLLLSLGPTAYLELIAPEPGARSPRPRWFELDTPAMRERLAAGPALVHWVVRVTSLAGRPDVRELSRGTNRWALTVAEDGSMPFGGLAPSLIRWHTPPPPTVLPDRGVRLTELVLTTPDVAALEAQLPALDAPVRVRPGAPGLAARLTTPHGETEIEG
ncbi:glyoxalase [Intrasporangium chromatireducens Q5-1]|uniref:Glyoxalase n=1 Tax=Intrasporangium chromatireducens Q5-1 TaxID=584657 RepID=W9GFF8_9MICO|nr:VOC family protein [Intrasporangium chromatireducens]EWT04951.1 glyoxalase [Intrasporangium chromatireducens Q5-1]